ncbi:MAG: citrate synthase [Candidatus Omnitrophica bacterium]|nr:citrate synthase [Candidatus Omnitrophota bacterium]
MSPQDPTTPPAEVRRGLEGVVAGETAISEVDGQRCQLIYQGYSIDELVGRATYEEVSFLLLHGTLPTRAQLAEWTATLMATRALEPPLLALLQSLPRRAEPMAIFRTAISFLGVLDDAGDAAEASLDAIRRKAVRTIALTPTIVAAIGRLRAGQPILPPKAGLGHAANLLCMLLGAEPSRQAVAALDAYFVLLADHGFNASTFTARTVTGTQSDYYSAITAAIGSLKGPLHGAANRKAMEMLTEIGSDEQVEPYVQRALADHKRFMGFGHRVYKGEDPRAKHLKAIAKQLGEACGEPKWFTISERLQQAVWQAKQLYINVDFYSASLLHYLGIPTELFTAMFACARMAGWSAHVIEQAADNRLIRPLALYMGPRDLKFVPLDQR